MQNVTSSSCKVCKNIENNTPYVVKEMMYGLREAFNYFQCASCKCLQIEDFIEDMSSYYPNDYYSFSKYNGKHFKGLKGKHTLNRYKQTVFNKSIFSNIYLNIFEKKGYDIYKNISLNKSSKILDVGCGNGEHFLYPLAEIGLKNVLGCDPFISQDIVYNNGLKIKKSDIYSVNEKWDLITYHHAFEHLSDPLENLNKVCSILNPNGVCVLRIPTVTSYAWEHYKTNWVQLDAPRHFFLHSIESIKILAEKANLELFNVEYDSTYFQFAGSELYKQNYSLADRSDKKVKKLWKKNRAKYKKMAKSLNTQKRGDQAIFFLRKKN